VSEQDDLRAAWTAFGDESKTSQQGKTAFPSGALVLNTPDGQLLLLFSAVGPLSVLMLPCLARQGVAAVVNLGLSQQAAADSAGGLLDAMLHYAALVAATAETHNDNQDVVQYMPVADFPAVFKQVMAAAMQAEGGGIMQ